MESNNNFTKYSLKKNINIPALYTVHYFKYGKNFSFHGESHNFWELVYIDSGKATIVSDKKEFTLLQGQAFLHTPNEFHTIYTTDSFANSVIISFDCKNKQLMEIADKVLVLGDNEKMLLNKIIKEADLTFDDKLDQIYLQKMNKKKNAPFACEQVLKNCIELLFVWLLRDSKNTQKVSTMFVNVGSNDITDRIMNILNAKINKGENVSLEELAYSLNVSKSYIKQQFKKVNGYSVIEFFIKLKINKAKELLSQNKHSVTEIADMLGFSTVFYFSRQFKKHTDMSPTEYVKSIKVDNLL
ncbi:MAG: helix-turn-helix domain-containing protein [Clostridia bacterium]|nr:helix-turn-helix domain-containing protein [Clostridia bacterium]